MKGGGGELIVAVEPDPAQAQMKLRTVKTPDGKIWWSAFTSFEEELKGADQVKSDIFVCGLAGCLKQHLLCRRSPGLLSIPGCEKVKSYQIEEDIQLHLQCSYCHPNNWVINLA